ncbi:MAG: polysaccharide biosynthesis protein, partial [Clostridia bacterium]|nr:polysaccharide biosynthesis protein [Clostridia bacterium]
MSELAGKKSTKLFVNGVLILTVFNVIEKIIGLIYKIPMRSLLGGEGMGYYNAAYSIYVWFFMISTAGLPVAMSLMISRSRAGGNFREVKKIMRIAFFTFFTIGLCGMALLFFGAGWFSNLQKLEDCKYCIMALSPTLFFVCLTSAFRGYFQGHQVMWPTAVSQFLESLGKLVFGLIFAYYAISRGWELKYVAASAVFGLAAAVFCGMLFMFLTKLLYKTQAVDAEFVRADGETLPVASGGKLLKELVVIAVPVTLSSSVMSLANLIDAVVISRRLQFSGFAEKAAAGLYGDYTTLAVSMFNLVPVLVYPIGYSLVPMLTALLANKDDAGAKTTMASSLKIAALISMPAAVGMAALAKPILSMIFSSANKAPDYLSPADYELLAYKADTAAGLAAPLLSILAVSSFLVSMLAITNAVLQSHKKQHFPLISMLVGAGAKIAASYFLIGNVHIGIFGAPISTDLCYIIVTVLNFYFCARHADFRPPLFATFGKPLIASALCGGAALGVYTLCAPLTSS